MSNPDFDQHLQQHLQKLPRQQHPKRDLWPGIEMAIDQQSASKPSRFVAIAASVAMLCSVGWIGMQLSLSTPATVDLATTLSTQHQQQMQALLVSYQGQPAVTDNWQQQLQELDQAALAIKKALQHEPENVALLGMLQQVYQQQINLIENVHSPKWQSI